MTNAEIPIIIDSKPRSKQFMSYLFTKYWFAAFTLLTTFFIVTMNVGQYWIFDIIEQSTCFLVGGYGILFGLFAILKQRQASAVTVIFLIILLARNTTVVTDSVGASKEKSARTLKIISANVNKENPNHNSFIELINKHQPDIFAVIELNSAWQKSLANLSDYSQKYLSALENNFGIGVYSKNHIKSAKIFSLVLDKHKNVLIEISKDNCPHRMLTTHIEPPLSQWDIQIRQKQLDKIQIINADSPIDLIVGDLNMTPWSAVFKDFQVRSGFRLIKDIYLLKGSWPSFMPPFMRFPIDHILVKDHVSVSSIKILDSIGSDHRPLEIVLNCPENR